MPTRRPIQGTPGKGRVFFLLTIEVFSLTGRTLSGTKIASQNRSDHGGRKRARNHSAAEIAGFFASAAAKKSLAAGDFWGLPQNRRKLAATTAASRRSRAILRPQRPRDTKGGLQSADKRFVRARGPQNLNPEVFDQTRCSRIVRVEFALINRELVKAEVFEKRAFEQTTPLK